MTSCYAPLTDRFTGNGNVLHFPDIQGNGSQTNWVFWGQSADMEIRVTSELGQLVRTVSLNERNNHAEILDNLNTGIYFINSYSGNNLIQKKLIITNK